MKTTHHLFLSSSQSSNSFYFFPYCSFFLFFLFSIFLLPFCSTFFLIVYFSSPVYLASRFLTLPYVKLIKSLVSVTHLFPLPLYFLLFIFSVFSSPVSFVSLYMINLLLIFCFVFVQVKRKMNGPLALSQEDTIFILRLLQEPDCIIQK